MGRYSVILADPPWLYHISKGDHYWGNGKSRRVRHYDGMTSDAIAKLPIAPLAADNAALFMWTTMPHLQDSFSIMQAWGFEYRTCAFSWTKINKDGTPFAGMGFYTMANTELCLLGIRGSMLRKSKAVRQVILSCRRQHSRKPDEQYDRIMRLFDGPYLELFARQQWPGWDVWGNQPGRFPAQPFLFKEHSA